jgi:hypothetical protein
MICMDVLPVPPVRRTDIFDLRTMEQMYEIIPDVVNYQGLEWVENVE